MLLPTIYHSINSMKSILLITTLITLATSLGEGIAQANSPARPTCKLTQNCVYGPQVSDRWAEGSAFEQKGDFDSATVSYTKALNAAEKLRLPGKTIDQLKLLRACATMGSVARLQGAMGGSEYMKSHSLTAYHTKARISHK